MIISIKNHNVEKVREQNPGGLNYIFFSLKSIIRTFFWFQAAVREVYRALQNVDESFGFKLDKENR